MSISALIKPASSACNLECKYCFYRDEIKIREESCCSFMTEDTANSIIVKTLNICEKGESVNFIFQGGEPLLAGKNFFRTFSKKATEYSGEDKQVYFSVQTNGTLIDDEFCELFKRYNYLVGVSLDGPEEKHNKLRDNSYSEALSAIELLKKYNIDYSVLSVITSETDAAELYSFYMEHDIKSIQPIYCLDPLDGTKSEYSLTAQGLARFRKRLFNKWFKDTEAGKEIYIRDFDNLTECLCGQMCEQCGYLGFCTPQLVIEADGSCYPCDFYCLDEFKFGNINEINLKETIKSKKIKSFLDFENPKNKICNNCDVVEYCGGGCKRYRNLYNQVEGYCPQKDFLHHALPKLMDYIDRQPY